MLTVHSGRQGVPMYPGLHEQTKLPAVLGRHTPFGPHGFGKHTSNSGTGSLGGTTKNNDKDHYYYLIKSISERQNMYIKYSN